MKKEATRDIDIRKVLVRSLVEEYSNDPDTRIVQEMGLCQGNARIDIAVINGAIHGYEIKSERDTLKRLGNQLEIYNKTLDFVNLIASKNHIDKAKKMIPAWWGLSEVHSQNHKIIIREVRKGKINPNLDPNAIVQLLWRDEALEVLEEYDLKKGIWNKRRKILWESIVHNLSINELKTAVRKKIRKRINWRKKQISNILY